MPYNKLASAIYNDVMSGTRGMSANPSISIEQLEDEIVNEFLQVVKEYTLKGLIPKEDLYYSINCIELDCKALDKCCVEDGEQVLHFEIPQLLTVFGTEDSIRYIGATDKHLPFIWYSNINSLNHHTFRRRGKNKPYVYIDLTPNENNMFDGFIFNAPLLKKLSIVAMFKDLRQLQDFDCCNSTEAIENKSFLYNEVQRRLTEKKIRFYRQLAAQPVINDQIPR